MITAGVDIGSTTTKVVLMQKDDVLDYHIMLTGVDCNRAAKTALQKALDLAKLSREDIDYIFATGYGRRAIDFANKSISEISANARGAVWLDNKNMVRTIIDVGGQDTKIISLNEGGIIENFAMNDKCAAGTGRFLEVMANVFNMDVNSFGNLALKSKKSISLNSTCTVFAESEVISLIAQKYKKEDIAAAVHNTVAKQIIRLFKGIRIREPVFFSGGGALNAGLKKALESMLDLKLRVSKEPQIVSAIGSALFAQELLKKSNTPSVIYEGV